MNYLVIEDLCVMCGEPVPEGRQVCPRCERKVWELKPMEERSPAQLRKPKEKKASFWRKWMSELVERRV